VIFWRTDPVNKLLNPNGAEVRAVTDLAALKAQAKSLLELERRRGQESSEAARDAGKVLRQIRDATAPDHQWHQTLADMKVPERLAQRRIQIHDEWGRIPDIVSGKGVGACLVFLRTGQTGEEEDGTNWVDKRCGSVEWYTPTAILDPVRHYFGGPIPLDPATAADNPTGATRFFTEADDGLSRPWDWPTFVNPPYGGTMADWCQKIHAEAERGTVILALLPCGARFSTEYWQEHILHGRLTALCFHRGRVKFVGEGGERPGNPYDSALYGFNADPRKFARAFGPLGKVKGISEVPL
jgi:hypothetical protein